MAAGLRKVQETISNLGQDKKSTDLSRDTIDVHAPVSLTTDHGTKVSNTDNWLKTATENQTGPSLLEDQVAREKVFLFHSDVHTMSIRCC